MENLHILHITLYINNPLDHQICYGSLHCADSGLQENAVSSRQGIPRYISRTTLGHTET